MTPLWWAFLLFQITSIIQANIRMAEELKRYQASDDLEKKVSKMVGLPPSPWNAHPDVLPLDFFKVVKPQGILLKGQCQVFLSQPF